MENIFNHNRKKKSEVDLRETQLAVLEVYKVFDEICHKIGVKHSVAFGTLIGAVRHKGFIPWDDDFDVVMFRPDYEKFLKYCFEHRDELAPRYEIHNRFLIENCHYNITRFCCNDYKLLFYIWPEYESGVFIDIYPLDGLGGSSDYRYWERKIKKIKTLQIKAGLTFQNVYYPGSYPLWKKIRNQIYKKLFVHKSLNFYWNELDKIGQKFSLEESDAVYCTVWTGMEKIPRIRKDVFEDLIEFDFENTKVWGPRRYDEFLTEIYGSYMKIPPIEEQNPQHGYKIFSLVE